MRSYPCLLKETILIVLILGIIVVSQAKATDPMHMVYSTYIGGRGVEGWGYLDLDEAGNIALISHSSSDDFPVKNAYQTDQRGEDSIVFAKMSPDGQDILFSTYFGGTGEDFVTGATVDSNGNMIAVGVTTSTDFPTINSFRSTKSNSTRDVFITKISADGQSILFSTYLGGGSDFYAISVTTDASDNIIITGSTVSETFPIVNAYQEEINGLTDAFITKMSPDGQDILFSTYFGGLQHDQIKSVATDSEGNIAFVGVTASSDFIAANAYQANKSSSGWDVFVSKISADGQRLHFSTYHGGSRGYGPAAIAVDKNDDILVAGETNSIGFPVVDAYQGSYGGGEHDVFISKFSADGQSILFSTYFGGIGSEGPTSMALDANSEILIAGSTQSYNFPTTKAFQEEIVGYWNWDGFVAKLSNDGQSMLFSTFIGGSGSDYCTSVVPVPNSKNSFLTAGHGSSQDFPTVNPYQEIYGGGEFDLFVSKFETESPADTEDSASGFRTVSTILAFLIVIIWGMQVREKPGRRVKRS